jgi:hypothetical protein
MAYVGLTKTLLQEVENELKKMQAAELAALPKLADVVKEVQADPELRSHLQAALWGDMEDLKPRLQPYAATGSTTAVYRRFVVPVNDDARITQDLVFTGLDIPPHRLVHRVSGYYQTSVVLPIDCLDEITLPETACIDKLRQLLLLHHECNDRWDGLKIRVIGFLDSCKSLNHALELWPDVAQFVPEHYVKKTKEKNRTKQESDKDRVAKEALAKLNTDVAIMSVTCAQMAGHNKGGV